MFRSCFVAVLCLLLVSCGGVAPPRSSPDTDDQTIAARVRAALLNDPVVHGNEISVAAEGGVVVLRGQVHGQSEADGAIAIARRIAGVRDVRSELQTNR